MLSFIICEDNKEHLTRFCNIINKVMMPYNFEYKINKFTQYNKDVEEIINKAGDTKIYILDIVLPGVSGLEIASEIRENDSESIIIFITAHKDYRDDIFYSRLVAMDYIPKDQFSVERLESTVKYVVEKLENKKELTYVYKNNTYRIPHKNIVFIEKMPDKQKCIIHTASGDKFERNCTVNAFREVLGPNFYKSHKACIVNLDQIKSVDYSIPKIVFKNNEETDLLANRKKKDLKNHVGDR